MADQERFDFCVVFTMSLCALESLTKVNKFTIPTHMVLKLGLPALGSYLKPTCEYELYVLSNTKVNAAKDHGESYMKIRPPLVHHL